MASIDFNDQTTKNLGRVGKWGKPQIRFNILFFPIFERQFKRTPIPPQKKTPFWDILRAESLRFTPGSQWISMDCGVHSGSNTFLCPDGLKKTLVTYIQAIYNWGHFP
jgi:hypothetical protein